MTPLVSRIVVPVDFSEGSLRLLEAAAQIARGQDAEIVVFHAFEPPSFPADSSPSPQVSRLVDEQEAHTRARLEALLADPALRGTRAKCVLQRGDPVQQIIELLRTLRADLLVLGTHGHAAPRRTDLGSVAYDVVRKCACPVLLLPTGAPRSERGREEPPPPSSSKEAL